MREVYLHVGPLKTGSTFLQDLLWRHRDDLVRQGHQHPGAHVNEMWLATNDVQDGAFVEYEMLLSSPRRSGLLRARPVRSAFVELASELPSPLDIERLVDRLVGHTHLRPVWEQPKQGIADLLGAPVLL